VDAIARFRTPRAADTIERLRDEIDDPAQWECWLAMAGRLPGGQRPSIVGPSLLGFVDEPGHTPHALGGRVTGLVPQCPVCETPSERVLTLEAGALPFELTVNPSFFWYSCACNALDFATVQHGPERRVFFTPAGPAGEEGHVLPKPGSLALEPHPNQVGASIDPTGGSARHQVGGHPAWIVPRPLPRCPLCQQPMRFLTSIDSGVTPFGRTGFTGTLFGLWCNTCAVATTLRQA
jgi:hypothetical protein